MRKTLFEKLKTKYDNITETFGYITKYNREKIGITKSHLMMHT